MRPLTWWARGPFETDYSHYLGPYVRFLGPDVESITKRGRGEWLLSRLMRQRYFAEPTPYDARQPNLARLTARLHEQGVTSFRSLDTFRD